ncbi:hypothetical protein EIN_469330 [Entamoeba invadens IP1]|uniref:Uncharacterized protein n=1 Tax=Entamoeba invadens IP1 TaxID=370355 RepID=A0A0A1TUL1_ENTIV|nr:hypothetical protein EIN_469330 [Entamoeba invadens IP1]ELP83729.1 hypothetical protein EIN_469330 [Entamoeba invadens IP1]|eukprot:XP_004183075.1 hypothetical protein EIN_469330 [Entamoeba invadens IP1]
MQNRGASNTLHDQCLKSSLRMNKLRAERRQMVMTPRLDDQDMTGQIEDKPLQYSLPLLRNDATTNEAILLIHTHLIKSKFEDIYFVYNCIDLLFSKLSKSLETVELTLKLLTVISSCLGSSQVLLKMDHSALIRTFIPSASPVIRAQTIIYLANVVNDCPQVFSLFKKCDIIPIIYNSLRLYQDDRDFWCKCAHFTTICLLQLKTLDAQTPTNLYEEVATIFLVLLSKMDELPPMYQAVAELAAQPKSLKSVLLVLPSLFNVMVAGFLSKNSYVRNAVLTFCLYIIDGKEKYITMLLEANSFFDNFAYYAEVCPSKGFVDMCYICSNIVAYQPTSADILIEKHIVQIVMAKLGQIETESINMKDLVTEFSWFFAQVLQAANDQGKLIMINSDNCFYGLKLMSQYLCDGAEVELVIPLFEALERVVVTLNEIDQNAAQTFVNTLEESGVVDGVYKIQGLRNDCLDYCNKFLKALDVVNHIEEL